MGSERRVLRCAIYTRKSSEHGLEQDFNTLHAQRESAEAYIKSQAHEGWKLVRTRYDDGGLSGGTMERPALQCLLADIKANLVDVVVVYKVDRLTRSLADFAKLVETFEAHGVSFVSVTQQFNTTTSMGRLTLNVLLSFAQFEREVAGERIRDKVAASRRKGIWMGGNVPLGYDAVGRKLIVNEAEAKTVRLIFGRYLQLGCVRLLRAELDRLDIRSKQRVAETGRTIGGGQFSRGALYYLLRNQVYRGVAVHKGVAHPGEHDAIIDEGLWDAVQAKLSAQNTKQGRGRADSGALLMGLLYDDRGNRMTPSHTTRKAGRYRYYVSQALLQGRKNEAGSVARFAADELEEIVVGAVRRTVPDKGHEAGAAAIRDGIPNGQIGSRSPDSVHDESARGLVNRHVERIVVYDATPRNSKTKVRIDDQTIVVRNRIQVIHYSRIVIAALQDAVEYDPARHHNQPPPELWSDDSRYLEELKRLIVELRRLNSLLEEMKKPRAARTVVNLAKHFDKFLTTYASTLGKGAGWLTVGLFASLLYQAGLGSEAVNKILNHLKLLG